MQRVEDLQEPDEARPAKRVRLEAPLAVTDDTAEEMVDEDDDWDDVYSSDIAPTSRPGYSISALSRDSAEPVGPPTFEPPTSLVEPAAEAAPTEQSPHEQRDGIPSEAIIGDSSLVAPGPHQSTDQPSEQVLEETQGSQSTLSLVKGLECMLTRPEESQEPASFTRPGQPGPKAIDDPEFMAAAAAQKSDQNAEWQFDSSDGASSSDSDDTSSDSDDSDSGSEGGYELLDAATAAKILMSGDGDDDDGEKGKSKAGGEYQPRTANEVQETVIPKPDVTVTPDMKITLLGTVERAVETLVLIKGATPGEYQVLEGGSVLCDENRNVVGAVAETLGRVQEPMYSVAFTNEQEIEEAGLRYGTKVYYVDGHSTFVFTQPLRNLKGTDASNVHDEEVGEDEIEFSDDEAEAEYKRQKKLAKKSGNAPLTRSAFEAGGGGFGQTSQDNRSTFTNYNDAPSQSYGGALSYDDDDGPQDFYQPLKRPDNLSALMAGGAPPPRPPPHFHDRGRGRGRGDFRGRGRGDRGRGRGGFDAGGRGRGGFDRGASRGGRGGRQQQQQQQRQSPPSNAGGHRGNSNSFPDRHNHDRPQDRKQHSLPTKPQGAAASGSPPPSQYSDNHARAQPPAPQSYQFNGYNFQYGLSQPGPAPAQQGQYNQLPQQPSHAPAPPAGSYINPAFYPQQPPPQTQAAFASYYAAPAYAQPYAPPAVPIAPSTGIPQQQPYQPPPPPLDLANILRRLGAAPPR